MCGRYALYGPVSRLRETFDAVPEGFEFEPRWNARRCSGAGGPPAVERRAGDPPPALGPRAVVGEGRDDRHQVDQRAWRVGRRETFVPGGVPPPALHRAGQRVLRVAAAR